MAEFKKTSIFWTIFFTHNQRAPKIQIEIVEQLCKEPSFHHDEKNSVDGEEDLMTCSSFSQTVEKFEDRYILKSGLITSFAACPSLFGLGVQGMPSVSLSPQQFLKDFQEKFQLDFEDFFWNIHEDDDDGWIGDDEIINCFVKLCFFDGIGPMY